MEEAAEEDPMCDPRSDQQVRDARGSPTSRSKLWALPVVAGVLSCALLASLQANRQTQAMVDTSAALEIELRASRGDWVSYPGHCMCGSESLCRPYKYPRIRDGAKNPEASCRSKCGKRKSATGYMVMGSRGKPKCFCFKDVITAAEEGDSSPDAVCGWWTEPETVNTEEGANTLPEQDDDAKQDDDADIHHQATPHEEPEEEEEEEEDPEDEEETDEGGMESMPVSPDKASKAEDEMVQSAI